MVEALTQGIDHRRFTHHTGCKTREGCVSLWVVRHAIDWSPSCRNCATESAPDPPKTVCMAILDNKLTDSRLAQRIMDFDVRWLHRMRALQCLFSTALMRTITHLADAVSWTSLAFVYAWFEGTLMGLGIGIGLSALSGSMAARAIKLHIRRSRPTMNPDCPKSLVEPPDKRSFPSGHTTAAFAVAGALLTIGSMATPYFIGFAVLVGFSRIYLGVHYPSDVIVGVVLGLLVGMLVTVPLAPFFWPS